MSETLNPKQRKFVECYTGPSELFGNGTQSYIEAYDPDRTKPNWYKTAMSRASQLLRSVKVIEAINKKLEEGGLNDQNVDKQLMFLLNQHSDFNVKLGALKEYNKLKQRITDISKVKHEGLNIVIGDDPDPEYLEWKRKKLADQLGGS